MVFGHWKFTYVAVLMEFVVVVILIPFVFVVLVAVFVSFFGLFLVSFVCVPFVSVTMIAICVMFVFIISICWSKGFVVGRTIIVISTFLGTMVIGTMIMRLFRMLLIFCWNGRSFRGSGSGIGSGRMRSVQF